MPSLSIAPQAHMICADETTEANWNPGPLPATTQLRSKAPEGSGFGADGEERTINALLLATHTPQLWSGFAASTSETSCIGSICVASHQRPPSYAPERSRRRQSAVSWARGTPCNSVCGYLKVSGSFRAQVCLACCRRQRESRGQQQDPGQHLILRHILRLKQLPPMSLSEFSARPTASGQPAHAHVSMDGGGHSNAEMA